MIPDGIILSTKECVNTYAFRNIFGSKVIPKGTLLMSFKLTVGKVSILGIDALHNEAIISIFPYVDDKKATRDFLFTILPLISQHGRTKTAIKGSTLNSESLNNLLIPLPPLSEQIRIVSKYKSLLPYINKYWLLKEKTSKLNTDFPEQLKKSILQEAVQGKLVPQDENDEPASVLLERIRQEKQRLIAEGKIKKDKHESVIFKRDNSHYEKCGSDIVCIDDELPFEIPNSWEWIRLGNVGETNIGLTYKPSDKTDESGTLVLRSSNIKDGRIVYNDDVFVKCSIPERSIINRGDLLICVRNGSRNLVGKCAIVDIDNVAFGAFMAKLSSKINPYIKIFLDSPAFRSQLDGVKTETINQITQEMLKKQLIPIPPYEEQKRIDEQVNILFNKISTL